MIRYFPYRDYQGLSRMKASARSFGPREINTVFFHSPCQDGLASAWVASKYAKEHNLNYEFVGISNNSKGFETDITNKNIIFFDYAPDQIQLQLLNQQAKQFFIVDHHKTNEERLRSLTNVIFKMDKSGVGLAWEYFYPEETTPMPLFLEMIQDRDLWTWKIHNSRPFCYGFFNYTCLTNTLEESFKLFDSVHRDQTKFDEILAIGIILEKRKQKQIEGIIKKVSTKTYLYKGNKVCIVNCDHELASDLGNMILKTYDYDFTVCWRYDHLSEEYWLSLRADGNVDVSEICKELGGGGHKNASGCSTKIHPSVLFSTTS